MFIALKYRLLDAQSFPPPMCTSLWLLLLNVPSSGAEGGLKRKKNPYRTLVFSGFVSICSCTEQRFRNPIEQTGVDPIAGMEPLLMQAARWQPGAWDGGGWELKSLLQTSLECAQSVGPEHESWKTKVQSVSCFAAAGNWGTNNNFFTENLRSVHVYATLTRFYEKISPS